MTAELDVDYKAGTRVRLLQCLRLANHAGFHVVVGETFESLRNQGGGVLLGGGLGGNVAVKALPVEILSVMFAALSFIITLCLLDLGLDADAEEAIVVLFGSDLVLRDESVAVGQHSVLDQFLVLHECLAIDDFTHYLPNGGAEGVLERFLLGRAHAFGEDCLRVTASNRPFWLGARFRVIVAGYRERALHAGRCRFAGVLLIRLAELLQRDCEPTYRHRGEYPLGRRPV